MKKAKEPSEIQKQKSMLTSVKMSMQNHMYRFNGKVYKQTDGGPIGDELSQAVARLIMIWWDNEFKKKCEMLKIELLMYFRYVDDTNKALIAPPLGTRFENNKLIICPEKIAEDEQQPRSIVVSNLLKEVANSISPMLQFEVDVGSNYNDDRLPILDLKVWKVGHTIRHEFYKKNMASKATLRAGTAYPTSQIRAIMVEEVLRRLRNCSPESTWIEKGKHLTEFALSLKCSGHSEHFRETVFTKAIERFKKQIIDHENGVQDLYRTREERRKQISAKGGKASKESWYKKKERATTILRIPYTPRGELKKAVQEKIQ